jgi:Uma2 family endonuclease
MLATTPRFTTFAEYLTYSDDSGQLYELFNGELVAMPPESGLNVEIATFLLVKFAALVGYRRVRGQGLELEVRGEPKNRYPDLTIITEEHVQQLTQRNTIRLSMAPPPLVVEVVSPGEIQRERDYIAKRLQYQDRGIPEYWLVDPQVGAVIVLELHQGVYGKIGSFREDHLIVSSHFPGLDLRANQIFTQGA